MAFPKCMAMLKIQKPIDGDDALLRLAQARLFDAGLGGELHPGTPEHLAELASFLPGDHPSTVHLPHALDILQEHTPAELIRYASVFGNTFYGYVLHDHLDMETRMDAYVDAFQALDKRLAEIPDAPWFFIEYAANIDFDMYVTLLTRLRDCRHVSACLDVGHLGIQAATLQFRLLAPEEDLCAYTPHTPDLPPRIQGIQRAVAAALPKALEIIDRITALGKPVHFHLHDGHPLSNLSYYNLSDHLGFLQEIDLPFEYEGRRRIGGMFGPDGLRALVSAAIRGLGAEACSFLVEVHPTERRVPLGEKEEFFRHWFDKTNAERMNGWLEMMLENAVLLRSACREALADV